MTYPAQPPYPPQGQPQPGYAPAPGYAPQPQYAPQPPAFQQPQYAPQQPQYAPQQPQFQQPQYAPAAPAPVPVRASLEEFSDQPTGGGGGAVTKFFKGRPQGSWLQLRVTRDLNSSDITQQQNDGVLQFFKTNGVPDPTKPKLVMIIKTEVLASSDPQGASVAFPDGAAAVWLKGLTKDALVASIGAAGLPDPDTIFRKGKIGGSIITMISAGEKPPNNPMFAATKLYNFQYQPGGNEMSAFQSEQSVPQAVPAPVQYREGGASAPVQTLPPAQNLQQIAQDGSGFPTAPPPAQPQYAPAQPQPEAPFSANDYPPPPTAPVQQLPPPPTQEYAQQAYAPAPSVAAPPLPPAPPSAVPATPSYAPPAPPAPQYAQQAPPAPPQAPQGYAPQPPAPPAPSPLDAERANTLARLRGGQQ